MAVHVIQRSYNDGSGPLTYTDTLTENAGLPPLDVAVASSTTNEQHTFSFTLAKLKSIFIVADGALTIKTNSSGSPQETINLVANKPYEWDIDGYLTVPFGGNVTTIYLTNGGGTTVNLKIRGTYDSLT